MRQEQPDTFEALDRRLRAEGWQRGYPRRRGIVDGVAIDHQVCAEATCDACGRQGLTYVPYVDPERHMTESGSTAVAACPQCGAAHEF